MNPATEGQLTELCQQVYRGSKPCAMMPILRRDQGEAKMHVIMQDCKFRFEDLSEDHFTLWIYINDEIPSVIDCLPQEPETAADHYLLGALFGYSNQAICTYLSEQETTTFSIDCKEHGKFSLPEFVFHLFQITSEERDDYKLIVSNNKKDAGDHWEADVCGKCKICKGMFTESEQAAIMHENQIDIESCRYCKRSIRGNVLVDQNTDNENKNPKADQAGGSGIGQELT